LGMAPSAKAPSIEVSRAPSQRSSSRRISGAAKGSSARSSSGGPRHNASAAHMRAVLARRQQALEAQRIDGVGIDTQLVAAPTRDDLGVGARKLLAQLRD